VWERNVGGLVLSSALVVKMKCQDPRQVFRVRRGAFQGVLAAEGRIAPWGPASNPPIDGGPSLCYL